MNSNTHDWPARPWILAAFLAGAGLVYHLVIDDLSFQADEINQLRIALAAFVLTSSFSLVFTLGDCSVLFGLGLRHCSDKLLGAQFKW